eukprot:6075941-Prymnesium_polylepis.1
MVRLCTFERVVCVTYNAPKRYCPPWVVKCDIVSLAYGFRSSYKGWAQRSPESSVASKLVLHSSFAAVELFGPDSHSDGALDCQGPV